MARIGSYSDEAIYPDVLPIEVITNDAEVGEYQVSFKVTDAAGETHETDIYTLIIKNINDPVYVDDGQDIYVPLGHRECVSDKDK